MENINCPKCNEKMEKVIYEFSGDYIIIHKEDGTVEKILKSHENSLEDNTNVEIDRCINCNGIWFDKGEYEKLSELEESEEIENKNQNNINTKFVNKENMICPRCNEKLVRKKIKEKDIEYEYCEKCEGLFLDSGEYSESIEEKHEKNTSIFKFLKDIFNPIKKH